MSEKCEHRHDDCNRRHGCGGGFALLIVLFILLIIIGASRFGGGGGCGYGGYGGYGYGGYGGYSLLIKTIENGLVQYAQGHFIHIFMCCDNLLMYRDRIKKKKIISIIPKKVSTINSSFSKEKASMLCKNLTANNV